MKLSAYIMIFLLTGLTITFLSPVFSWGNGGLTTDLDNPKYGSHDWFAQHALDFLPDEEKSYLQNNLNDYLLGTEMPDNSNLIGGLNDKTFHHVYYNDDRSLQDDIGATRTQSEFLRTIHYLNFNEEKLAARSAGVMTHYIADLSVFAHTMGAVTVWGSETHHSDFENYVGTRTTSYDSVFNSVLVFDGSLDTITGYDAAIQMGLTSTFGDGSKIQSNVWMDTNYDWSSQTFEDSATANMNKAVNLLADMLHTIYVTANVGSGITPDHILISEVYYDTSGTDSVEEYVELYNPLASSLDISGWKL
ncbi:MAG: zinc dependent phospholipase C family protein, partial [Thaumarchaeota archaeon]|nr:zinc dependent phospholipase C family protein [Nitrososphaerota archaeon]